MCTSEWDKNKIELPVDITPEDIQNLKAELGLPANAPPRALRRALERLWPSGHSPDFSKQTGVMARAMGSTKAKRMQRWMNKQRRQMRGGYGFSLRAFDLSYISQLCSADVDELLAEVLPKLPLYRQAAEEDDLVAEFLTSIFTLSKTLPEQQQKVFNSRYGSDKRPTQSMVAHRLGISQKRVSELEKKAIYTIAFGIPLRLWNALSRVAAGTKHTEDQAERRELRYAEEAELEELLQQIRPAVKAEAQAYEQQYGIDAEEEAFAKLVEQWPRIRQAADPVAYARRVAQNAMRDALEQYKRQMGYDQEIGRIVAATDTGSPDDPSKPTEYEIELGERAPEGTDE